MARKLLMVCGFEIVMHGIYFNVYTLKCLDSDIYLHSMPGFVCP